MTEWAHRIRRLEAAGWSLTDLARTLGIAVSTVSDIKNGRTLEPKGMAAVRLFGLAADVPGAEGDGAAEAPAPDSAEQRAA
jgi:transcriptional regulator with XRE-family HTH domain